jgi:hypothetical protein
VGWRLGPRALAAAVGTALAVAAGGTALAAQGRVAVPAASATAWTRWDVAGAPPPGVCRIARAGRTWILPCAVRARSPVRPARRLRRAAVAGACLLPGAGIALAFRRARRKAGGAPRRR